MIRTNSVIFKLAWQLTIILAILFSVLILSNIYSLEVVQNNTLTGSKNTLRIYKATIQNKLENYTKDLIEVFENNIEHALNFDQLDENGRYFKTVELKDALAMKMSSHDSSGLMFVQIPESDLLHVYFNNRIPSKSKLELHSFLKESQLEAMPIKGVDTWSDFEVNNVHYIYQIVSYSGITFGTIVQADALFSLIDHGEKEQNQYVLSNLQGEILSSYNFALDIEVRKLDDLWQRYEKKYLINSEFIPSFGEIIYLVEKQNVFSGLQTIQWFIVLLGGLSVIIVPLIMRALTNDVLKPILELVKASKEVEKGQHQFQSASRQYSMEFMKLFHSFQSMVHEITALKIQSYEEEIERSRSEIKYLQLQIRPHFYLNAISTITSLTYQNKNEEIRELIHYLSKHLRYIFTGGMNEVKISEEIDHAENYIRMQEIRYPNQIFYMTEIDPVAGQVLIPQFIIQTFIENSFKHAMFYGAALSIFIRVIMDVHNDQDVVKIIIEDNGEGFTQEWLDKFNSMSPDAMVSDNSRIGIANIQKTLQLIYKRNDLLKLINVKSSGARVELLVPIVKACNGEKE